MIPVGETYFGPNYRLGGDQGLWGICQAMSMALSLCLVEKKKKKRASASCLLSCVYLHRLVRYLGKVHSPSMRHHEQS